MNVVKTVIVKTPLYLERLSPNYEMTRAVSNETKCPDNTENYKRGQALGHN